jgi:ATP-dependent protease Clp ATPase subunit
MSKYRNAYCSFCRKSHSDVGPLVEGPPLAEGPRNVYICGDCIELCQSIIDQEKARRSSGRLSDCVKSAAGHLIQLIESATSIWDPRIGRFLGHADRSDAGRFLPLANLCQSAASLIAVSEVLKDVKGKGLQAAEAGLLEEIEGSVCQLQAALDARADQEALP